MLKLRKQHKSFTRGHFQLYEPNNQQIMMYSKRYEDHVIFVVLNWTAQEQHFQIPEERGNKKLYTLAGNIAFEDAKLGPYESAIYEVS